VDVPVVPATINEVLDEPDEADDDEADDDEAEPEAEVPAQPAQPAQPVAEPVPQPVAEPVPQPVAEPVPQPVAQPVPQPVQHTPITITLTEATNTNTVVLPTRPYTYLELQNMILNDRLARAEEELLRLRVPVVVPAPPTRPPKAKRTRENRLDPSASLEVIATCIAIKEGRTDDVGDVSVRDRPYDFSFKVLREDPLSEFKFKMTYADGKWSAVSTGDYRLVKGPYLSLYELHDACSADYAPRAKKERKATICGSTKMIMTNMYYGNAKLGLVYDEHIRN
jgi:hypothetical protein